MELGIFVGLAEGAPENEGEELGCKLGFVEMEGIRLGWLLGLFESEGGQKVMGRPMVSPTCLICPPYGSWEKQLGY